jgi:hypothetical protein
MPRGGHRWFAPLPGIALVTFTACQREDPEIRALTEQAAQADEAAQQLRQAWSAQFRRLALVGVRDLRLDASPLLLTAEQKRALEARIRVERDSSRRALLQEVLDKEAELRALSDRLLGMKAALPPPEIAGANDSHYGLALRFLKGQGLSEEAARKALSRVPLSERMAPGFEVYHFYVRGEYGTWVCQGGAAISPRELDRREPDPLPRQRDAAVAAGRRLQKQLGILEGQKRQIEREISAIQAERLGFLEGQARLQRENADQLARLNSLHYLVGVRAALEAGGIIEIPLFGLDHSGPNWRDAAFTRHLDLRTGTALVIRAQELGLKRIGRVIVVPGSYTAGEHYRLTLDADGQAATVELLAPPRFKNDKVVFAVEE